MVAKIRRKPPSTSRKRQSGKISNAAAAKVVVVSIVLIVMAFFSFVLFNSTKDARIYSAIKMLPPLRFISARVDQNPRAGRFKDRNDYNITLCFNRPLSGDEMDLVYMSDTRYGISYFFQTKKGGMEE